MQVQESFTRYLVANKQDTANGAGAVLTESSDERPSLGLADMEGIPLMSPWTKQEERTLNVMNWHG